jgi:sulfide:quinone oxidoreductase
MDVPALGGVSPGVTSALVKSHNTPRSKSMTDLQNTVAGRDRTDRLEVLIAGGGVAGLEAAFALREFAGDRVDLSILAPTDEFVYRPMSIAEPFTSGWAQHYPLAKLAEAAGATLMQDALVQVDVTNQQVRTASGAELSYDALVICLGASLHKRYDHTTNVDDAHMDELLHGLVQDIEGGYTHSLAFIVPTPMPWPLPAYELALMASERAWDMQTDLSVTVLTPEKTPLAIFGTDVSLALSRLLAERKIEVVTAAYCEVPEGKTVQIHPSGRSLKADRIIALPELRGPAIIGLPSDNDGFIPIDEYAAIRGVERVWAAGDATDYPVKHGGVSAQMADTAARCIASLAGASVEPRKFDPVLEGVLLTGGRPRYLRDEPTTVSGPPSELLTLAHGEHPPKIAARYLTPHLTPLTPEPPGSVNATVPVAGAK